MAIQQILGKQITKFDTEKLSKNPNFVQSEEPKVNKKLLMVTQFKTIIQKCIKVK